MKTQPATALAILLPLHRAQLCLSEALVLYEIVRRQRADLPVRMSDIADSVDVPYTTVSRIVWSLADRHGLVRYEDIPGDRRSKRIVLDERAFRRMAA